MKNYAISARSPPEPVARIRNLKSIKLKFFAKVLNIKPLL